MNRGTKIASSTMALLFSALLFSAGSAVAQQKQEVSFKVSAENYAVYAADNGDKFFTRAAFVVQNISGKLTATTVGPITGGTGKFAGIGGIVRTPSNHPATHDAAKSP